MYFLKKYSLYIILIFLIIPQFLSLIRPGFFPMQDDLQAFRLHQMDKCIKDLQIPCRWVPDMGYQYGYPQFNFYPPSVYYLGEIFHLLGFQIIDTVKVLFILGFIVSTLLMFIFLKSFLSEYPAFAGAILYSYVPYKAVEVYVRGALSEFFAFIFFPLIFWSSYQLIKLNKLKYFIWLAISIGLLLTTHNLMSFIFLPIFGIWAVALVVIWKKWTIFPKVVLGILLGFGLAAFFILPLLFESKFVHLETLLGGYFDYRQHFVDLKQLFLFNNFGYGSSILGPNDDLSLSTGAVHWLLGCLAIILAILTFKKNKKLNTLVLVMGAAELFILFLMHQRSSFIWEKIPPLWWLQFPWRFLSDSVFLSSFLGAISIHLTLNLKKQAGLFLGMVVILSVFILHLSFFQPQKWLNITDTDKFSAESWEKQLTISIFDYLPIYAKFPPNHKAPSLPEVLDGSAKFLSYQKGSNFQRGEVQVEKPATIRLPLFDFPGMKVTTNKTQIPHWHDDCRNQQFCLGLITFNLSAGTYHIMAKLEGTPVRTIGNIITLLSLFLVGGLFLIKNEKHTL